MDAGYSPDLEIDHDGKIVAARDFAVGQVILIPMHMVKQLRLQGGRVETAKREWT